MASRRSPARDAARLVAACLGLSLLAGCGTGVLIGVLFGEGDERFDDLNTVPAWFEEHRGELEVIMRLLRPHEAIRMVDQQEPRLDNQYREFSPADYAAYTGAWAIMHKLGIVGITVMQHNNENPTVSFCLWRIGLTIGGSATFIRYDESKEAALKFYNHPPDRALDLGAPNWLATKLEYH